MHIWTWMCSPLENCVVFCFARKLSACRYRYTGHWYRWYMYLVDGGLVELSLCVAFFTLKNPLNRRKSTYSNWITPTKINRFKRLHTKHHSAEYWSQKRKRNKNGKQSIYRCSRLWHSDKWKCMACVINTSTYKLFDTHENWLPNSIKFKWTKCLKFIYLCFVFWIIRF